VQPLDELELLEDDGLLLLELDELELGDELLLLDGLELLEELEGEELDDDELGLLDELLLLELLDGQTIAAG
jgi:hypothetical protein